MVPHEPGEPPGSKGPKMQGPQARRIDWKGERSALRVKAMLWPRRGCVKVSRGSSPRRPACLRGSPLDAASELSHQPFEIRVRQHRKFSVTAGTFRGCLVVKDLAILTRADGQRVFDLAAAIMWAGQCDIATMLREVHSHEAYASLVKTVARTEEGSYRRAMAPCTSVRDCISSRRVAPRSTRPPSL